MKKITLFFLALFLSAKMYSSHIAGGEITYVSLGNNQYEVHLKLYWDCSGGFNPGTTQTLSVDGCLGSQTITLDQSTATPGDGIDISQICSSETSTCNGGLVDGKNMIEYVGIVTLPGACTDWIFSWTTCCRGGNIINVSGGTTADSYLFANLNNVAAPNNNSPIFTAQPLPYMCVNQAVCYNFGIVEQDGNTLQYSLVDGLEGPGLPLTYNAGYSGTSPIQGITIDPVTGQINFTPTTQGDFVVTVRVDEFDANGVMVGSVIRDIQVVVQNCTNQTMACGSGGLTAGNITGNGATLNPANPHEIQICEGIPFSFNVLFTDPNPLDSVLITTNLATNPALAGAIITTSYPFIGQINTIQMNFSWTAPPGSANLNTFLTVTVRDNACPIPGQQVINYFLNILPAANAGPDTTICNGDGATLQGTGPGGPYNWSYTNGTPVPVGPDFSCNPCQNPVASPTVTTTYVLQTSGGAGCLNTDEMTLTVVPTFTWALDPGATADGCTGTPVQLGITPVQPDVYTYVWTPATGLNQTNINNPTASFTEPGTQIYSVIATSAAGCIKTDQIAVTVQQGPPDFTLINDQCLPGLPGAPIQLDVIFPCLNTSAPCALGAATTCPLTTIQVGTATTTTFPNPTPFMGLWEDGRFQMLFRASELQAMSINAGILNSMALNIPTVNSNLGYAGFSIKMKCTATNSLSVGVFEGGTVQVFSSALYNPIAGWNTFIFTAPYTYDGFSNLLIEICYDNSDWSSDDVVEYTATTFPASVSYDNDGTVGCMEANSEEVFNSRPNVRFAYSESVNPNNYTYSWAPATGLSNPNIKDPTLTPVVGSTTYTVTVTTLNGLCSRTDEVNVTVGGGSVDVVALNNDSVFCNDDAVQLLAVVGTQGGTWSHYNTTGSGGGIVVNGTGGVDFHPELSVLGTSYVKYSIGSSTCGLKDSIMIVVNPAVIPNFVMDADYCSYDSPITLSNVQNICATGTTCGWTLDGAAAIVFDPSLLTPTTHTLTYTTDAGGNCPRVATQTVSVHATPVVDFSADTLSGCIPSVPVAFTSTVTNTPASSNAYVWSFGDASGSGMANPIHLYSQAGIMTVSLNYTDINGCVDNETKPFYVTINSVPEPEFVYEPAMPTTLEPHVEFLNTTRNTTGLQWNWDIA
ncbi:MAG: PKD domain-containing protein, partial [Bacteroidota bacterium]|nr:PKD domain-containing protein [Bacteroidota bacterium]